MPPLAAFALVSILLAGGHAPDDVVWNSPSANAAGSMPIGNGVVAANVWVEEGGDLVLLLARNDAWSECGRLLKLGRVRVKFDGDRFAKGVPFEQRLVVADGVIRVETGAPGHALHLRVFVDADSPVVRVVGECDDDGTVSVVLDDWRKERHVLKGDELNSCWTMRGAPDAIEVAESADVVERKDGAIRWHHRNETSIVPLTLAHQGLAEAVDVATDPLLHRTFGGSIRTRGVGAPAKAFEITIATHCAQTESVESFRSELDAIADAAPPAADALATTRAWWNAFFERSWIIVSSDDPNDPAPAAITRGYALQRYLQACASRGAFPIKFNGSLFTVEPGLTEDQPFDADWRKWGDCYWWQNTRLPYHAMLAAGDFDLMEPLFRMYRDALPLCEARARIYHGARGAYFPETMTIFGTYSNGDYGWDRTGHAKNEVLCPWWANAWNQGPELVALMLDRFDHTDDARFLERELLPMARSVLAWFDSRFERDAHGTLVISPTQALETHWHGVVNDAPCVAGLHAILERLLALKDDAVTPEDRATWNRLLAALPPLPTRTDADGALLLAAAETFDPSFQNCETPELYAVFPFRRVGLTSDATLIETARGTFERRHDRFTNGWPQDGMNAALLGLADEARANLAAKAANSNPKHRFPAIWGPNFDWAPDQCHGGNLMTTLQLTLLQVEDGALRVVPAWPKEWAASFRLHAPHRTVVEGTVEGGYVSALRVTPNVWKIRHGAPKRPSSK